jgi:Vault protein inter-alpha-trypsin domain
VEKCYSKHDFHQEEIMKFLSIFLTLLFSFLGCHGENPPPKVTSKNFKSGIALAVPTRGRVMAGSPARNIYGPTVLSRGDLLSTGQGEVEVTHENGVRVLLGEGVKLKIEDCPVLIDGDIWAEFPRGLTGEIKWKGWKIRGKGSSLDIKSSTSTLYVFNGELLMEKDGSRYMVKEGNSFKLGPKPVISPVKWWDGNAVSVDSARGNSIELVPGQGVLGARRPGTSGKAHLPLVISSMDVKVYIIGDMAITEVKQVFLNPSSNDLEGIYRFRAPDGALITGFAVDRSGKMVFGRIKGKELAKQQYSSNVYQGSREDPALLEWEGNNQYKAFIYPIKAGQKRTIFTRYSNWLTRHGKNREFRYYNLSLVGYNDLSPQFGEFSLEVHLDHSGVGSVVANLGVKPDGNKLIVRESDYQTSSDFYLNIKDGGITPKEVMGWYGRPIGRNAPKVRRNDFILTRVWPFTPAEELSRPIDLVILVDMSADTADAQLNLARLAVEKSVSGLKPGDRVAIVTGDLVVRSDNKFIEIGKGDPVKMLESLAIEQKGGATDIAALLKDTAKRFNSKDGKRAPILLYIGNGRPTVGEITPATIAKKWFELPYFVGFRAIATEEGLGYDVLRRISANRKPLKLTSPAALRELPSFISAFRHPRLKHLKIDLGGKMGKLFPAEQDELEYEGGEPITIVGQLSEGTLPSTIKITGEMDGKPWSRSFGVDWGRFTDTRELARRYASEKLKQLMDSGASSELLMDLGLRYGLVTPFTSLYVPTESEARAEGLLLEDKEEKSSEKSADDTIYKKADKKVQKSIVSKDALASAPKDGRGGKLKKESSRRDYAKTRSVNRSAPPTASAPRVQIMNTASKGRRRGKKSRKRMRKPRPSVKKPSRPMKKYSRPKPVITSTLGDSGIIATGGQGFGSIQNLNQKAKPGGYISANKNTKTSNGYFSGGFRGNNTFIANNMYFCTDCGWKRKPSPCSAVSKLPLWQRRNMWRERLGRISAYKAIEVYNDARRLCEAPGPYSKRVYLRLAVSMFRSISDLVSFYKQFSPKYGFDSFLRSAIIARIKSVKELLYVKRMLGLGRGFQRAKIEEILEKTDSLKMKIRIVQKFIEGKDKDPWLKIKLIGLLEENKDAFKAERLISGFFGNPLLDEELRLISVEYLIRNKKLVNARRLLSEIVEFSPSNPLRRRILGSLYRAFGWHKYAVREFQSLVALTASAHESMILLALAWEEFGSYEKSLSLLSKVMTQGDPGSGIVKLARIIASAHLARLRHGTTAEKAKVILQKGRNMALFRNDEGVKILLFYKHPKSDLELLWGEPNSYMQRVSFLKPRWGVEGIIASKVPAKLQFKVVRGNPKSLRTLDAEFLIILNEGTKKEVIISKKLKFVKGTKEIVLNLSGGKLSVKKGDK